MYNKALKRKEKKKQKQKKTNGSQAWWGIPLIPLGRQR
jgi:hypothetical protein